VGNQRFGESISVAPLVALLSTTRLVLLPAMLIIALALLISSEGSAATIEGFSVRRIDNAVEVQFPISGKASRWQLQSHGQQLWLNLARSRVAASAAAVSAPLIFPIAGVGVRELGGGRVRLIINVRGQVDYAVAQMPHALVVRIATSGRAVDVAEPLLGEMEERRHTPVKLGAAAEPLELSDRYQSSTNAEIRSPMSAERIETVNPLHGIESASVVSGHALSANSPESAPLAAARAPTDGTLTAGQAVQPVAQQLARSPGAEQDNTTPIVVIDAGHGGFDPGTESAGGIAEKSVALAIARRLAAALEARGLNAELTRNDDRFLSLSERTELANRAKASLFVSIHLNSSPDWNTSGIETYYLNNTTDRAAIRLARIENAGGYSAGGPPNLNYILTNLQQDYKALESSSLARMIETEVAASVSSSLGLKINALGAKKGPFYVLVGAEMPSVLIECGFLSNPREARLLIQPDYQKALADGIATAVMRYFNADAAVGNL
jgi:N-acetylmuramoyl-L-alanine amidase